MCCDDARDATYRKLLRVGIRRYMDTYMMRSLMNFPFRMIQRQEVIWLLTSMLMALEYLIHAPEHGARHRSLGVNFALGLISAPGVNSATA